VSAAAKATMAAAAAATMASAAAASPRKLYPSPQRCELFLVEEMERRQADVRDFFITETEELKRCRTL
jgi:hypothetical protein